MSAGGTFKYASSAIAASADARFTGFQKDAQMTGVSNMMGQPMWFSPLHTPQNWQIASKRREIYQWQVLIGQALTSNYTFKDIDKLSFEEEDIIQDRLTDGLIYEVKNSEQVLSGQGNFREFPRYSVQKNKDILALEFSVYGYWRNLTVSENHPLYVINGQSYRHKRKLEKDAIYRRSKGIPVGGDKPKIDFPENLIGRKESQDIQASDYLLAPIPKVWESELKYSDAWLLGLASADGCVSLCDNRVHFTINKYEKFRDDLESHMSVWGNVISREHHNSKLSQRIQVCNKECHSFFAKYITGKLTEKCFTEGLFNLDKESRLHVLGGYFDGDGSFSKREGKLIANNYSCDMADQIYWLLLSVGIRASLGRYPLYGDHYETDSKWCYRVFIPQSDILLLKPYMRSGKIPDDFEPRNTRELRFFYEEDGVTYLAQPIESIKQFRYTGRGYDLQIDPERSFVASGFVTSNCRFFYENEPKVAAAIDFYCFTPETQILMANGAQKSISSIQPGDLIRSHDGNTNKVVRTFARQTEEEILRISIAGVSLGQSLGVTKGHELLTKREGEIQFVQAQHLKEGDYLLTPADYSDSRNNKTIDTDFAWLLGLYAAEGCGIPYKHTDIKGHYSSYYKGVYLTLDQEENGLVEKVTTIIHKLYGNNKVTVRKVEEEGIQRIAAYGKGIADDLIGLCPGMSKDGSKRFAPIIMKFGDEDLLHLLAGFLDGDGCFNKVNGFQGVGVSKTLSEQIANICDRLGLEYSFTSTKISKINRQTCYNVRLSRRACSSLSRLTYKISDNCVDEDKISNTPYFKDGNYIFRKIRSIKQTKFSGIVYDLEIENSHSYVANRISCHNSRFPMNGFKLDCKDHKIWRYYHKKVVPPSKLNINENFKMMSSEYFMLGDVFVHTDIACPVCGGSGIDPGTGDRCNHPGGTIKSIKILNPDWMEVQQSILAEEPTIVMVPDEELKRIVFYKQPKNIYDSIPNAVKKLVIQNKPIPMSNRTISHIKHMPVPYGTYGSSLIRRLFTTLAYKTKIMTANWIVAERLILPVRVVKIGSDARPATSADIADIQQQIAATANDPNLTIVTHHNFDYEWYGAAGKILQVTQEMENIGKEILDGFMLNQSLLNGEMCIPQYDRMLTKDGLKSLSQISEDDEIATFNIETGMLEYQKPTAIHEYDYDGDLMHFQTDRIDFACTPNHRMLYQKRDHDEWIVDTADTVRDRAKFRKTVGWHGEQGASVEKNRILRIGDKSIPFEDQLKIIAYYVSEGHIQKETRRNRSTYGNPQSVQISQTDKGKGWSDLCELRKDAEYKVSKTKHGFAIHNTQLARILMEECGHLSHNKKLPLWVKDLSPYHLRVVLGYLINGDGALRTRDKHGPKKYYTYYTKSMQLRDDVMEIALKCGYFPRFRKRRTIWEISFSDYDLGKETITLESKKHDTITKLPYRGKVWCVTVPNGFIVTERNGKLNIHSNSGYQSAQVGVETLIRRIESWRSSLAEWCETNIFKPIAEMQGFIDKEESEELGETIFLYPTLKWNDLNLKDKTQWYQLLNQLHDKQLISAQTFLEELDLDYNQEVKRMRYEQMQSGPAGAAMGQPPGMDAMGGMGGMGGGAGGMPPGGGDPGAMGTGGEMAPGMGGPADAGMMGGAGAGGMAPGGMAPMAEGGKVLKKGKQKDQQNQLQPEQIPMIKLTSIEQAMAEILTDLSEVYRLNPQFIKAQFPVENPTGAKPYALDFALPHLKLGVECLHPEQRVMTKCGSKFAKDVTHEDDLLDQNGKFTKIKNVIRNKHDDDLVVIKPLGLRPIKVTKNHPLMLCKPKSSRVLREEPTITRTRSYTVPDKNNTFINASEIAKGDYLMIPKCHWRTEQYILDLSDYQGKDHNATKLPQFIALDYDLGWLLGIYAAEGCVNYERSAIELSFNIKETELIARTQNILESKFNLKSRVTSYPVDSIAKVIVCCNGLSRWFIDNFGLHAPEKQLPAFILHAPRQTQNGFIQAFMEGDGCIRSESGDYRLISSSEQLLTDMQFLVFSMGYFATLSQSRKPKLSIILDRECTTRGLWELTIKFDGYTKSKHREDECYYYVPVNSVTTEHYDGAVVNFETEDHTYCAGHIVTHNCDGDVWHSNPEQAESDKQRDYLLAQRGWTILRFDDEVIEEAQQAVRNTIGEYIGKAMQSAGKKTASKSESVKPILHTMRKGEVYLVDDYGDYLGRFYKSGLKTDTKRTIGRRK